MGPVVLYLVAGEVLQPVVRPFCDGLGIIAALGVMLDRCLPASLGKLGIVTF